MKKIIPILLILLFVCLSRQQTPFTNLYNEFDRIRGLYCVKTITRNPTLESQARSYANGLCTNSKAYPPDRYYVYQASTTSSITNDDNLISNVITKLTDSHNVWNCQADSLTNTSFVRHVLVESQSVGCSLSYPSPCSESVSPRLFKVVCLFEKYAYTNQRGFPISGCSCTSTTAAPTTAAPTTAAPTTESPTTAAPTTAAPTTAAPTTAAPTTAAPTTESPTTAAPTTAAPTTAAPTTESPTTAAPTTAAPTTESPTTAAPTTAAPTGVPSYQAVNPTPTNTINDWLRIHHTARDCLNLPRLTWSESLASDALEWAIKGMANCTNSLGKCAMFHSQNYTYPARIGQGENINYIRWNTSAVFTFNETMFITSAVEGWYSEYLNFTCSTNTCSINDNVTYSHLLSTGVVVPLKSCGHYTQIIWRNTTQVGCAFARCNNDPTNIYSYFGACRYSPQGNTIGVNPLSPNVSCTLNCTRAGGRSLSSTTVKINEPTPVTKNNSFFKSDSEIYVLALSIFILVVVISIFVVVLINFIKNRNSSSDEYQLMETK